MSDSYVGKVCPFCMAIIKPGSSIHVCETCGIPHHTTCWEENGGCSTFGCERRTQTLDADQPRQQASSHRPTGVLKHVRKAARVVALLALGCLLFGAGVFVDKDVLGLGTDTSGERSPAEATDEVVPSLADDNDSLPVKRSAASAYKVEPEVLYDTGDKEYYHQWAEYTLSVYSYDQVCHETVVSVTDGFRELYATTGAYVRVGEVQLIGGGTPELVIEDSSGGSGCDMR